MNTGWLMPKECRAAVSLCGVAPSGVGSSRLSAYILVLLQAVVCVEAEACLKLCQIG